MVGSVVITELLKKAVALSVFINRIGVMKRHSVSNGRNIVGAYACS